MICPICNSSKVKQLTNGSAECLSCYHIEDIEWFREINLEVMKLEELISKLQDLKKTEGNLPVMLTYEGWIREGEYFSISSIVLENLDNQNATGDPEFYGNARVVLIK